jgi:uncharacterized repeat protein (TIGR03803 family)
MGKLSWCKTIVSLCVFFAVEVIGSSGQTFKTLHSFDGTDGNGPIAGLVQATDGTFYGTTWNGGSYDNGTVFKITPQGKLTTLHSFDNTDGINPAGLIQASDGNFYGTTFQGGSSNNCDPWSPGQGGCGTVFKISPEGTFTRLHSFDLTDGAYPNAGLIQASDGNFYGTTNQGGSYGNGTVFKMTPTGTLTILDSTEGYPSAGLIQASDGNFYGTTSVGGSYGTGSVFKITPEGKLTTLHSFDNTGWPCECGTGRVVGISVNPATLIQASDGNFYGTTAAGGSRNCEGGCGTVFKISPEGTFTRLHSFDLTDGSPSAGLIQASDGNFYGTTFAGGSYDNGTVFKITPQGNLTTLHSFAGHPTTDAAGPGTLVQATNGKFYGTASGGGAYYDGTVFSLSTGLSPFVETSPTFGIVGTAVIILGNNLTDATSVTFNGKASTFTVISSTEIKTTVPNDATTGKVKVQTSSGELTSNVNFRVTATISSFSPAIGPAETVVTINGESFTGATSVTFGGVKATSFTVDSSTQITATVPTGAKTGKITVTTPGGTATRAGTFTVT